MCVAAFQCVAVRCSAPQCAAVRRSALRCVAVRCSALQRVAVYCSAVQCITVHDSALHCYVFSRHEQHRCLCALFVCDHVTPAASTIVGYLLQCVAVCFYSVLQCVAWCCSAGWM